MNFELWPTPPRYFGQTRPGTRNLCFLLCFHVKTRPDPVPWPNPPRILGQTLFGQELLPQELELELGAGAGCWSWTLVWLRFHFQLVACASHGFPLVEGGTLTLKGSDGVGQVILWVTLRGLQELRIS